MFGGNANYASADPQTVIEHQDNQGDQHRRPRTHGSGVNTIRTGARETLFHVSRADLSTESLFS